MGQSVLKLATDELTGSAGRYYNIYSLLPIGGGTLGSWSTCRVGQDKISTEFYNYQSFMQADFSPLPAGATVVSATMVIDVESDESTTDFTFEMYEYDFDVTVDSTDYRTLTQISGFTRLASMATSALSGAGEYSLTNDTTALVDAIQTAYDGAGEFKYMFVSDRLGTEPSGQEYITLGGLYSNQTHLLVEFQWPDGTMVVNVDAEGNLRSNGGTYADVADGTATTSVADPDGLGHTFGQWGTYNAYQYFANWDLNDLPMGVTVTGVDIHVKAYADASTTDFNMIWYPTSWTVLTLVTGAAFVPQAALASATPYATLNSSAYAAWLVWTGDAALVSAVQAEIDAGGTADFGAVLASEEQELDSPNVGVEYVRSQENATFLKITYTGEDLQGDKYINDFNSTDPLSSEKRIIVDDKIRGVKNVWKNSFPNIDGPVNATHTELNLLIGGYSGGDDLPTGTNMAFYQAAAPTGWTQNTTLTNLAGATFRVETGTGGGAVAGTHTIDSPPSTTHAHSETFSAGNVNATLPSHRHYMFYSGTSSDSSADMSTTTTVYDDYNGAGTNLNYQIVADTATPLYSPSSLTGSNATHGHTISGGVVSAFPTAFSPKYVNMILAEKD